MPLKNCALIPISNMNKKIFLALLFLFIGIGTGCFFRGEHAPQPDQELYDLLDKILQNGGGFNVLPNDQDSDYKSVDPGDKILPEDIENIYNLGIRNLVITQDEMTLLAKMKRLEYIRFVECEFSGDVFAPMENSMIRELYVAYSTMAGISGRSISKLKNLDTLGLTQSDIPDEFYKNCKSLNIKYLGIVEVSTRTENLKDMLPLPNLSMLLLCETDIDDGITGFLDELPNLNSLTIWGANKLQCEFIRDMKNTDNIERIEIGAPDINDEILSAVTRFENLKYLTISGDKITKDSIPVMESLANGDRYIILYNGDEPFYFSPVYDMAVPEPNPIESEYPIKSNDDQIDEEQK